MLNIDIVVYFQVIVLQVVVYEISNYIVGVEQFIIIILCNVVGGMMLEQMLILCDQINVQLCGVFDEVIGCWGLWVVWVELCSIDLLLLIQVLMEKQMKVDWEK